MNFPLGVIIIVGVLAAIILGLIASSPDDIIQPRMISDEEMEIKSESTTVTEPDTAEQISVNSYIMPKTATVGDVLLIEVEFRDDDENVVDHVNYDISGIQDGDIIPSEPGSHRHPGKHPIHETTVLGESLLEIQVTIQGLGHGDDISEPKGIVTTMTVVPEPEPEEDLTVCTMQWDPMCGIDGETYGNLCMLDAADVKLDYEGECITAEPEAETEPEVEPEPEPVEETPATFVDHSEVTIGTAEKSGFGQDCAAGDGCYTPVTVTVDVGGKVIMTNTDTTGVHTFTSGTVDGFTPSPSGTFDSEVLLSGDSFEWVPNTAGEVPYYCMLHTWMQGTIIVQE